MAHKWQSVNLYELNFDISQQKRRVIIELINIICTGLSKISKVEELRDGNHLVKVISTFERFTRWPSNEIVALFLKYRQDEINAFQFIDGWLEKHYQMSQLVVNCLPNGSELQVVFVTVMVLNVLYTLRKNLPKDLVLNLEGKTISRKSSYQ